MEMYQKKEWGVRPLSEVVRICDSLRKPVNNTERQNRIANKSVDMLFPYFGATGQVGFIDDYIIDGEYVLLGEDGAPFLDGFATKAYIINGKAWVNNHAHILKSNYNNKFLCYYLNNFNYKEYVSGTTRLKLTQASMMKIPIPVPPLTEQERIVAKIEELFSELDSAVTELKTVKGKLQVYRQAVLKEAFEGKKSKNKQIGNIIFHDISSRELTKLKPLPSGWKYVYLSDLGNLARGKSKHRPRNDARLFEDGKYPFFQTGDVKSAQKELIKCEKKYGDFGLAQSKLWPKGTLCITIAANIAETSFLGVDACFPDSIVGFTPNEQITNKEYIRWFIEISKDELWAFAPATAQKNINLSTLENLIVPYCSLEEQYEIVQYIEEKMSIYSNITQAVDSTLSKTAALRQSILKQAFEGKL